MLEQKKHPVICFGECLWDILPSGKMVGGAPMNVAYHLQKLEKNPAVISRIGYDELGNELIKSFEEKNVCTEYFQVDYDVPTSTVKAEVRPGNEVHFEIVKNVAWDYIALEENLEDLVKQADYFVYGSLATRSKQTRDTLFALLEVANNKVLDINLRPPFYNRDIIEKLLINANFAKLNLAELELITGWFSPLTKEEDRIKTIRDRFNLDTIVITKGAKGAILNKGGEFVYCQGLKINVCDTIGSGDSFLAAIISKTMDKVPINEALDFANNLAAFVTTQKGGCPEYDLNEITKLNISKNEFTITQ
ncbi:carbohydrate kinase family protein [Arachidicoccus sp.]|uniref:carbohydrate kinase family protein n=1 Tax=Arachidicoccus sp. TaxID=1872624 RepID=UPI003D243602